MPTKQKKEANHQKTPSFIRLRPKYAFATIGSILLGLSVLTGCDKDLEQAKKQIELNNGIQEVHTDKETEKLAALSSVIDRYLKDDYQKTTIDTPEADLSNLPGLQQFVSSYNFGVKEIFNSLSSEEHNKITQKYKGYVRRAARFGFTYHFTAANYNEFSGGMSSIFNQNASTFKQRDGAIVKKDLQNLRKELKHQTQLVKNTKNPDTYAVAELGYVREVYYAYKNIHTQYKSIFDNPKFREDYYNSTKYEAFDLLGYDLYYRLLTLRYASFDRSFSNTQYSQLAAFGEVDTIRKIDTYYTQLESTNLKKIKSQSTLRNMYYKVGRNQEKLTQLANDMKLYGDKLPVELQEYYVSYISNLKILGKAILESISTNSDGTLSISANPTANKTLKKDLKIVKHVFNKYYKEVKDVHMAEVKEKRKAEAELKKKEAEEKATAEEAKNQAEADKEGTEKGTTTDSKDASNTEKTQHTDQKKADETTKSDKNPK